MKPFDNESSVYEVKQCHCAYGDMLLNTMVEDLKRNGMPEGMKPQTLQSMVNINSCCIVRFLFHVIYQNDNPLVELQRYKSILDAHFRQ